jgi:hypothetical protein
MTQIELPDEVVAELKHQADHQGLSIAQLIARLVGYEERKTGWPPGFFEKVVGGWKGPLKRPSP